MTYPSYNFNDPDLNYATVNGTVDEMFSDLRNRTDCGCRCGSSAISILNSANILRSAIKIDLDLGNTARYKEGTELAYKLLYNALPS